MTPPVFRIWCARCDKLADRIAWFHNPESCHIDITVSCHGKNETHSYHPGVLEDICKTGFVDGVAFEPQPALPAAPQLPGTRQPGVDHSQIPDRPA